MSANTRSMRQDGAGDLSRRGFLAAGAASAAGALAGCKLTDSGGAGAASLEGAAATAAIFVTPSIVERREGMPYRTFGKTGEPVSMLGIGGYHIGVQADPEESVRIIRTAIDAGINFMDNAWEYNGGVSETRMGLALRDGYRDKVFLMTKVCGRDATTAMSNLEESLRRLRTDVIDLWQFHECNYDNDPDLIFAEDGAVHAALRAREQGKIRYIGFTGHKSPHIHLKMLAQDFEWDALQCPINVLDAQYRSFAQQVLPVAIARNLGVVGMKPLGGDGNIPKKGGVSVAECLRYSLSLNIPLTLSGMTTVEELEENMEIVRSFSPMEEAERVALLDRVRPIAGDGRLERFKSTQAFDSAVHQRQHGFA